MLLRHPRRRLMLLLFLAVPALGCMLFDDRGPLFGFVVGVLAVGWLIIEERHIL